MCSPLFFTLLTVQVRIKRKSKITWAAVKVSARFDGVFHIRFEKVVGDLKVVGCESKFERWMWFEIWNNVAYMKHSEVTAFFEDWA